MVMPTNGFRNGASIPKTGEITCFRTIAGQTQYQDGEDLCALSCPSVLVLHELR